MREKIILGINTTIIAMGIVFLVLFFLNLIVRLESIILKRFSRDEADKPQAEVIEAVKSQGTAGKKGGLTRGQTLVTGVMGEETVAVIMAAVSYASDIPLSSLKVKSIRRIDDTWSKTAKQESVN